MAVIIVVNITHKPTTVFYSDDISFFVVFFATLRYVHSDAVCLQCFNVVDWVAGRAPGL